VLCAPDPAHRCADYQQLFTLQIPFAGVKSDFAVLLRVQAGERPPRPSGCEHIGLSEALWAAMQRGWAADPLARPSLEAFLPG
jgi:hypothetical protein